MSPVTCARVGVGLPTIPGSASAEAIDAACETAANLQWTDVWVSDHVLVPAQHAEDYGHSFDPLMTLGWIAGRHPGIRIGTRVLIVPMRNAVILAKELATLDVLSNGRLNVGVGVGWLTEEFRNLDAEDRFRSRGAYLEEAILLWRHLWAGLRTPFAGHVHPLIDFFFAPLPVQGAGVPIWIGGRSPAAISRAGRLGDGYAASPSSPQELIERKTALERAAEAASRPTPPIAVRVLLSSGDASSIRSDAESIRAFHAAGADQVVVVPRAAQPTVIRRTLERLAAAL